MQSYWVYILASRSRRLYVGVTSNLESRVWQHKSGTIEGFTKRYHIQRLVHFEETTDVIAAIAREKVLKGWRRSRKVSLIEANNPLWDDLSAAWSKADSSLRSE